ncbi:choice-of-anchor A family protein [Rheinheimera maricola]|uniref:Choice-of-anchor A family protein n=1 Tax=Rheinheimera maricola TaxID=2793282 RepID=A0ABS7X833_9GAMM|nr:choice-of-anchor A family protein [Rheinheimera maricola]MBZ9611496.1 choice-of-anchor A family protein [Rheinheimera maricola]
MSLILRGLSYLITPALLLLSCNSQAAPINLGVAQNYSGFFFADVSAASDIEGRLAIGGNLTNGFDIGYRNPVNSQLPSLVVGGDINIQHGTIYNGPQQQLDTNAGIGPASAYWLEQNQVNYGTVYYGGNVTAHSWSNGNYLYQPDYIDFNAAYHYLSALSDTLINEQTNGQAEYKWSQWFLTGDGVSDLLVFDLGDINNISNLVFSNIKQGATIVINSHASDITLAGYHGNNTAISDDIQGQYRDRILFNFSQATQLQLNTFVNGSILAPNAAVTGTGHIEGTLIGQSLSASANGSMLEIGYEPFSGNLPGNQTAASVTSPSSFALFTLGLLLPLWRTRRSKTAEPLQR